MNKRVPYFLLALALLGVFDAGYLTLEHFQNSTPPCSVNPLFGDCGTVLRSEYALIVGIPVALLGLMHYLALTATLLLIMRTKQSKYRLFAIFLTKIGFVFSLYFVCLQLFVIKAICAFCMVSAINSFMLFIATQIAFPTERKKFFIGTSRLLYKTVIKNFLFKIDPVLVHERTAKLGSHLGNLSAAKRAYAYAFKYSDPTLTQKAAGITFNNPIGLSAGFDYEARLTQILPSLGFGFQTVGTITNSAYKGNPGPMLGRLPKSKSLMVNKGFKNLGADATIKKLEGLQFAIPVGVSIGRTNSKTLATQKSSVNNIVEAFTRFEKSNVEHSYYELNISCPNLYGNVSFYSHKNLNHLLTEIESLNITKPVFIKMPIEKEGKEVFTMLKTIAGHSPAGVIFGNLQKDRKHPSLDPKEVQVFRHGNFSGKPTFERSNDLIRLAYKYYKDRFVIIGSGGVFNAADAYEKITSGATLVQLITGIIFQGPQLIADINLGLSDLLKKDGFKNIKEAVGSRNVLT